MSITLLIPAAGSGTRMGREKSKLLLTLGEKTIIEHTLSCFDSISAITKIIVLIPEVNRVDFEKLNLRGVELLSGASTRAGSVRAGLNYIKKLPENPEYILIHDGARCFISREIILNCIEAVKTKKAVTTAIETIDTLVQVKNQQAESFIDRNLVWSVQTPQAFSFELINKAHEGSPEATDDASLVAKLHPISIVRGARENFKITTVFDYEVAKTLIQRAL